MPSSSYTRSHVSISITFKAFSWLVIFGTGRYCFDVFGALKIEDGTGRDGKTMEIIVAGMGRYGTVRDSTMTSLFHDGTGR